MTIVNKLRISDVDYGRLNDQQQQQQYHKQTTDRTLTSFKFRITDKAIGEWQIWICHIYSNNIIQHTSYFNHFIRHAHFTRHAFLFLLFHSIMRIRHQLLFVFAFREKTFEKWSVMMKNVYHFPFIRHFLFPLDEHSHVQRSPMFVEIPHIRHITSK